MVNQKKYRVAKGKQVRKETGLPFPLAMKIGKVFVKYGAYEVKKKFPEVVESQTTCKCCGPQLLVRGPKGVFEM